ncbi:MAG: N-acetyltransferase [Porphyromonadaceae bacterium]|nr:N-acetyltransferase [Porphyromonadaceae bacterium]
MGLIIKAISTKKELREFIKFPDSLYSGNKLYVPAIHSSELSTLSVDKNPAFEFCKAKYWLAVKDGVTVGRIAGIINDRYNEKYKVKYARFGWLDFVDDKKVLIELFQAARRWALSQKMEYIHGPLGFSSFDPSGILIEGFDEMPTSFAHYNFPYYPKLIEELGYKKDVDWVEYNVKVPKTVPEKFLKGAELVKQRHNLHSTVIRNKKDLLKYSDDVFNLINAEYNGLYAFAELSYKQIEVLKEQFISYLKPEFVSIILNSSNEVVAFGITIPSLSKAQQKAKGRLFPFGFMQIKQALQTNDTADLLLIAVRKDYQNKGVNGIIFNEIISAFIKNGITNIETTRNLETNQNINNLWNKFESRQHKRSRCYFKQL